MRGLSGKRDIEEIQQFTGLNKFNIKIIIEENFYGGDKYMDKRQLVIQLKTIKDVKDFVTKTSSYAFDMYVQCGNFVVDAKSLMGILSLDLERPFILSFDSVDFASIEKDFKKWAICND